MLRLTSVDYVRLSAIVEYSSYMDVRSIVDEDSLYADIDYLKMVVVGLYTDPDSKNRILSSAVSALDASNVTFTKAAIDEALSSDGYGILCTKGIADTITLSDNETITADFNRAFADASTAADLEGMTLTKPEQDAVATSDAQDYSLTKGISESVTAVDTADVEFALTRTIIESITVTGVQNLSLTKPLSDSVTMSDLADITHLTYVAGSVNEAAINEGAINSASLNEV